MADVKTENEIIATALKNFGRSETYAKIVERLAEELEDYRARVLESQEFETEARAGRSGFDNVKYSMQDKVQWSKHFVQKVIDMLPSVGEDRDADEFRKCYERRIESFNTHILRKIDSDYPMFTEVDKLRFAHNFRETFVSKDESNKESVGLELDSLIRYYSSVQEAKTMNTNPYSDDSDSEDKSEVATGHNPFASTIDEDV